VAATDVGPHAERRLHPAALRPEVGRALEQLSRKHAILDDALVVVDVGDEQVDGRQTLDQPVADLPPLLRGDHAGDDIEGPGPVDVAGLGVQREGDTHGLHRGVGGPLALEELVAKAGQMAYHPFAADPRATAVEHLVPTTLAAIGVQAHMGDLRPTSLSYPVAGRVSGA